MLKKIKLMVALNSLQAYMSTETPCHIQLTTLLYFLN